MRESTTLLSVLGDVICIRLYQVQVDIYFKGQAQYIGTFASKDMEKEMKSSISGQFYEGSRASVICSKKYWALAKSQHPQEGLIVGWLWVFRLCYWKQRRYILQVTCDLYFQIMSEPHQNKTKKEEEEAYLKSCQKCTKFFTNEQAYQTHLKMKHEDAEEKQASEEDGSDEESDEEDGRGQSRNNSKKASKGLPIRSRMLQIQRNELEDNIYTFLGELGERNVQPSTTQAEIINFANSQKMTGQTNYSVNKVIRTPYEEAINCSDEVPLPEIEKSKNKDFLLKLKKQLQILQAKVEYERQIWQLRDPMAPEEEVMDEFSLMDVKKLIQNYPKRNINLEIPHFSIFLLWIGRICKSPAFKEFFLILGEYVAEYYAKEEHQVKGEQAYENWRNFQKGFENKKMEDQQLQILKIFDEKGCKKFIEYYVTWADIFRALNI